MDPASLSGELLLFLFLAAMLAGFIDTLAGGGGLITLPALMMSGVPPLAALGTNKLQGTMGTATSSFLMIRNKRVRLADVKGLMVAAFIGSILGTIAIQFIDAEILTSAIPLVLLLIALYFLVSPNPGSHAVEAKISPQVYQKAVVPVIGCYDGMFGPGTGSFFTAVGVALRGHGLVDATAVAKTLNFATNIASLMIFLIAGQVVWLIGILMMFGQLLGASLGSHWLLRAKPAYLRMLVVVVCLGMLVKYGFTLGWFGAADTAL